MPAVGTTIFGGPNLEAVTAPGGESTCVHVPVRPEGRIVRVIVVQLTGAKAGFDVEIFCSATVCPTADSEESSSSAGSTTDERVYRVMPKLTAANLADSVEWYADSSGYAYANVDGSASYKEKGLQMRITPAGSGAKTFAITVATIGIWQ